MEGSENSSELWFLNDGPGPSFHTRGAKAPLKAKNLYRPRLWALIIGINKYIHPTEDVHELKGAVSDADAIEQYIKSPFGLGVPCDQIVNLRDGQATRQKIIDAFRDLRKEDKIQSQDPILIYYAGHGGRICSGGEESQYLVPVDYLRGKTHPISDHEVESLLNGIAAKHGNNITVILDCCYSGSGTRGDVAVRECKLHPDDVPDDLDTSIPEAYLGTEDPNQESVKRGSMGFASGFAVKGMKSHILLAACSAKEQVREDEEINFRGRFTLALLQLFKHVSPDRIRYNEVLIKIAPIQGQNPQCEGYHRDRIVFDAQVRPPARHCYDVTPRGKVLILEGGQAHGISDGAEFTLYDKENALNGKPLGIMAARDPNIKPFRSILEPKDVPELEHSGSVVAIQTKTADSEDLLIHVSDSMRQQYMSIFEAIKRDMSGTDPDHRRIHLVEESQAKLLIVPHPHRPDQVTFNLMEEQATKYGFTRIPWAVGLNAKDLGRVLCGMAHYRFHLNAYHPNNQIRDHIAIDFFPLGESGAYDDNCDPVLCRVEGSHNLYQQGKIEVMVPNGPYGMSISNYTPWDLYFSCFFFDHTDFSIFELTEDNARVPYQKDCNLQPNSVAHIGLPGPLGIPPLECSIPKGLNRTLGFLKFYFYSQVVDLSHIPQPSPFASSQTRGSESRSMRHTLSTTTAKNDGRANPVWGTILIPVILRRKK